MGEAINDLVRRGDLKARSPLAAIISTPDRSRSPYRERKE